MREHNLGAISIFVRPNSIIELKHNEDWNQAYTIEDAKKNMETIRKITNRQPIGLFINVTHTYTDKKLLDYYHTVDIGEVARALLLTSFATKLIGNMYLKLAKKKANEKGRYVPHKLFTDKEKGMSWLQECLKKEA